MPLEPRTVKRFFAEYLQTLDDLGVHIHINSMPVEIAAPIPFHDDDQHGSYDADAVFRFWHALRLTDFLLKRFSTSLSGPQEKAPILCAKSPVSSVYGNEANCGGACLW